MLETPQVPTILVKRFARHRLYDTAGRRYLSREDLRLWQQDGTGFVVLDADTGEDVTRTLLA